MAHRLSKITTRTGDRGETGLGDGTRVPKSSPRVQALGDIDELNSAIGLLAAEDPPADMAEVLSEVQHDLFDLGGEISIPGHAMLGDAPVERLEGRIEAWNAELAPLREFILPGDSLAGAALSLARAIIRRAERRIVELFDLNELSNPDLQRYLNRLSSLCFVLELVENKAAGHQTTLAKS